MRVTARRTAIAAFFLFAGTPGVHAQQADLRYVAPLPEAIVFATLDTIESSITGLPTGDMTTSGVLESRSELRFTVSGDSIRAAARLLSLSGSMNTPMGNVPMTLGEMPPTEFMIGPAGPQQDEIAEQTAAASMGSSPEQLLGTTRAFAGLVSLPARIVQVGETWSDTVTAAPDVVPGMSAEMTVIVHGTYTGDTIADGVTLNRIALTTEMKMNMAGNVNGMDMTQTMTTESEESVLWDSARRTLVHRDVTSRTTTDISMPQAAMRVEGRGRSITTLAPAE